MLSKKTSDLTVGESMILGLATTVVVTVVTVAPLMIAGIVADRKQKKELKKIKQV